MRAAPWRRWAIGGGGRNFGRSFGRSFGRRILRRLPAGRLGWGNPFHHCLTAHLIGHGSNSRPRMGRALLSITFDRWGNRDPLDRPRIMRVSGGPFVVPFDHRCAQHGVYGMAFRMGANPVPVQRPGPGPGPEGRVQLEPPRLARRARPRSSRVPSQCLLAGHGPLAVLASLLVRAPRARRPSRSAAGGKDGPSF